MMRISMHIPSWLGFQNSMCTELHTILNLKEFVNCTDVHE